MRPKAARKGSAAWAPPPTPPAAAPLPRKKRPKAVDWDDEAPLEGNLFEGIKRRKATPPSEGPEATASAKKKKKQQQKAAAGWPAGDTEGYGGGVEATGGDEGGEGEEWTTEGAPRAPTQREMVALYWQRRAEADNFDPWALARQRPVGTTPTEPAAPPVLAGKTRRWVNLSQPVRLPPTGKMGLDAAEFGPAPALPERAPEDPTDEAGWPLRTVEWARCPIGVRDRHVRQFYGKAFGGADAVEYTKWLVRATDFEPLGGVCHVRFRQEEMAEYAASLPAPAVDGCRIAVHWLGAPPSVSDGDAGAAVFARLEIRRRRAEDLARRSPSGARPPDPGALFCRHLHWTPELLKQRRVKRDFNHVIVKAPKGAEATTPLPPPEGLAGVTTAGAARPFLRSLAHVDFGPAAMRVLQQQQPAGITPMQAALWPQILTGRNVVAVVPKMLDSPLCYALPALLHARVQHPRPEGFDGPIALILAPGPTDCWKIANVVQQYVFDVRLLVLQDCSDHPSMFHKQATKIGKGVDCLVATPDLFLRYLEAGAVGLGGLSFLVLDQLHALLARFRPHLEFVRRRARPDCQVVVATKAPGDGAAEFAPSPVIRVTFPPDPPHH